MRPTIETDKYSLWLGDCLPIMQGMEAGSVDAVIVDVPYFDIVNHSWDKQWKNRREYVAWIVTLAHEWKRILKDNSSVFIFQDDKNCAYVQVALDETFLLLNNIVWYKPNNFATTYAPNNRCFTTNTERALFYTTQYDATGWETVKLDMNNFMPLREYFQSAFKDSGLSRRDLNMALGSKLSGGGMASHYFGNIGQWEVPTLEQYQKLQKVMGNYLRRDYEDLRRDYEDLRRDYEDLRRPFNADTKTFDVIEWPIVNGNDNTDHPTTKPLGLMRRIISVITNKDQVILDCCMGSGTTGQAALELGRRFIGIELREDYFEIARLRIEQAARQEPLFVV